MLDATRMANLIVDDLEMAGNLGGVERTYTLTIDTAVDNTDYVFKVTLGTADITFTYDSGSGATTTNIATGIRDAINNDTDNDAPGVIQSIVSASAAAAVVTIVSATPGIDFYTMSEADTNMTLSAASDVIEATERAAIVTQMQVTTDAIVGDTVSPAALSSDVDDYNPTGLNSASYLRVSASGAARTIGGIVPNHHTLFLTNIGGTNNVVLEDEATSGSAAANRFALGGSNHIVGPGLTRILLYDSVSSRWRVIT